jgi:carbon-monoxide dehydrogenase large subunit
MWESANLRVHLTGKVILTIGTQSHGQGHETTMAQIVSEELGIPMEDIIVQLGDTLGTPFGYGTYASRSAAVGGMAVYNSAQKIK